MDPTHRMLSIRFFYLPDPIRNPLTHEQIGKVYRPKIPIRLSFGHTVARFLIDCLVDSGSDINLFPAGWGEAIGINIKKGKLHPIYGIGGIQIDSYIHKVKLYIGTRSFSTNANFSYEQTTPLLGRDGFFNHFKEVHFNEKEKYVELEF